MWGELDLFWGQMLRWPPKEGAWKLLCHRPGSLDWRAGSVVPYSSGKSFLSEIQLSFMCTLSCSEVALLKLSSGQIDPIFLGRVWGQYGLPLPLKDFYSISLHFQIFPAWKNLQFRRLSPHSGSCWIRVEALVCSCPLGLVFLLLSVFLGHIWNISLLSPVSHTAPVICSVDS